MDSLVGVVIVCAMIGGILGLFWSARAYDKAVQRYKGQQEVTDVLQQRAIKILEREEAIAGRAEALLDRLEKQPPE
jgi:hypothetical protein